jgi:hypothetical protein
LTMRPWGFPDRLLYEPTIVQRFVEEQETE